MYDPSTNTWTTVAPMNTPRAFVAATNGPCQGNASDTCVYAISGSDTNNGYLSSVEMYTPSNNTWSAVASLNTAQATAGRRAEPARAMQAPPASMPSGHQRRVE
jgi:hypothetical protein